MIRRRFIIGDKWLYFKLYTGFKLSNYILNEIIKPGVDQFVAEGIIKRWFFVRYHDPDYHIRLRFELRKNKNYTYIIDYFTPIFKMYISEDIIFKIQVDTYNREIERYGQSTITFVEDLFHYDSNMVIRTLEIQNNEFLHWIFCLKAIDAFLNDLDFSIQEKKDLLYSLNSFYSKLYNKNSVLAKQISHKYRSYQKDIHSLLVKNQLSGLYTNEISEKLVERSKLNRIGISKISELIDLRSDDAIRLISSIIHMHVNRMFSARFNQYELILYDFLFRFYKSENIKQILLNQTS